MPNDVGNFHSNRVHKQKNIQLLRSTIKHLTFYTYWHFKEMYIFFGFSEQTAAIYVREHCH